MSEEPNRWESVYRSKEEAETNWFEDRPQVSLELLAETRAGKDAEIVDVGAGSSRLVDCLVDQGFHRITVLDLLEPLSRRLDRNCLRLHRSNGWWRTSCIGGLRAASTSGMIGLRSIS